MTANYKIDAMTELRKFLWNQLKEYSIFDPEEYYSDNLGKEIIPILPVQQSAEMNQFLSGKKHIVYDKIGMSYEDNWAICCEQILFTIYLTGRKSFFRLFILLPLNKLLQMHIFCIKIM
mgnify:CR=1 FL=1